MPRGAALRRALAGTAAAAALATAAGCAQPGTPASSGQAATLAVGTGDISTACGYREELTEFEAQRAKGQGPIVQMALTGARKLAAVYARDQSDIYQGESAGAVLGDSISLLRGCGLGDVAAILVRARRSRP